MAGFFFKHITALQDNAIVKSFDCYFLLIKSDFLLMNFNLISLIYWDAQGSCASLMAFLLFFNAIFYLFLMGVSRHD